MNPVFAYYANEEDERERYVELQLQRKIFRAEQDPLNLPEKEFRKLFRVSKDLYITLREELTPHIGEGVRSTKLSIDSRILGALRFFASGSYQKGIGDEYFIAVSQPTMSNLITEVAMALQEVAGRWIKFPTSDREIQEIKAKFMERFQFPGTVGVIDGTHIAILAPNEDEHIYFNRKGYHSKNVQIICDANLTLLNVNANFGGASHDSFIWHNSAISTLMENRYHQGDVRSWLLGDSGYPLQPWLLTPVTHTIEGTPQRRYDDTFKVARNCVERCIGLLKGRFRCLLRERMLRYDPHKASLIINACCVLHNMCVRAQVPEDDVMVENVDDGDDQHLQGLFPLNIIAEGQRQRNDVINLYFRNL